MPALAALSAGLNVASQASSILTAPFTLDNNYQASKTAATNPAAP